MRLWGCADSGIEGEGAALWRATRCKLCGYSSQSRLSQLLHLSACVLVWIGEKLNCVVVQELCVVWFNDTYRAHANKVTIR
jgi:hypothetical protein